MRGLQVTRPITRTEASDLYRRAKRWSDHTEFSVATRRELEQMLRDCGWQSGKDRYGVVWKHPNGQLWSFQRACALTFYALAGDVAARRWMYGVEDEFLPHISPLPETT